MKRRDFIKVIAGSAATAWPLTARAQQPPKSVIGFLRPTGAAEAGHLVAAVRQGLRESGYPSDKVAIESRWADGRPERLPKLAAELVALHAAPALKAATTSIPIVIVTGADPVAAGLVSSISRPSGNITGVSFFDIPVTGKRLALLRELVPDAKIIAVLQDHHFFQHQAVTREIETAASAMGQKILTIKNQKWRGGDECAPHLVDMVKRFLGNALVRLGVKCPQTIDACHHAVLEISHCNLLRFKAALRRRVL
jgi:putative tryptophan/tyrosine transport system substrate-binding protein